MMLDAEANWEGNVPADTESSHDDEGEFEFGLDLILDGRERVRETA